MNFVTQLGRVSKLRRADWCYVLELAQPIPRTWPARIPPRAA